MIMARTGDVAASSAAALPAPSHARVPQWLYLVPVAGAPLAHFAVTSAAQWPRRRRFFLALVAAATVTAVGNRLFLMGHAGYPGEEGGVPAERFRETTPR